MLILFKTSIKTRNLTLMFAIVCMFLSTGSKAFSFSGNQQVIQKKIMVNPNQQDTLTRITVLPKDTLKTVGPKEQPVQMSDENIDFQINSDITYLSLKNFVSQDARSLFIQAQQKEKEVIALTAQNDSLRNAYASSSEDRRQSLANIILKNESKTIALNEEIPHFYQQARHIENQYWQSATDDQINRFQKKINWTRDSLEQVNRLLEQKRHPKATVPDTIILANSKIPVPEPQNTQSTGVVYKIQIASAKYKLPPSIDKLIKKLSIIRQIENYKDEKGVTIYTTGNLKTWKEAMTMQEQVKQEGVKNPTVVAYKDGKKIPVNEARKITHEL